MTKITAVHSNVTIRRDRYFSNWLGKLLIESLILEKIKSLKQKVVSKFRNNSANKTKFLAEIFFIRTYSIESYFNKHIV